MQNSINNNQELFKIISYVVIAMVILVSLVALIAVGYNVTQNDVYYDSISETNLNTQNTGSISDNLVTFIGLDKIADGSNIPADINRDSAITIRTFITYAYPKADMLSYKNNTIKAEGNTYNYDAQLNTGQSFKIKIIDLGNGGFKLHIEDVNNEVFVYESKAYAEEYKDIRSLPNLALPRVFQEDDIPPFSITYSNDRFNLNINACGDEKIINAAKDIANNWIKSLGFNPEDANLNVPPMCDGGYN